jgi:catalase (peroxidase I)
LLRYSAFVSRTIKLLHLLTDAKERFVCDFLAAWEVTMLDRFDPAGGH